MNRISKRKKKALHEEWVFKYLYALNKVVKKEINDQADYLSIEELYQLKKLKSRTLFYSGLLGAIGVVILYLPRQLFPQLFFVNSISIPFFGVFHTSLTFTFYGFLLAMIEIGALTVLHVKLVKKIADICNFPPVENEFVVHINALMEVSLEKPAKRMLEFGVNPLAGLPKFGIFIFTSLYSLKATLSNLFVKFVLGRVLGRFYVRSYIDYIGIPIFAFWNIFATNKVVNEAMLRIMAPNIIKRMLEKLTRFKGDPKYEKALFDSLQFMAVTKRDFHHNHYLLVNKVFFAFNLNTNASVEDSLSFLNEIAELSKEKSILVVKLLLLGLIIDGSLSLRERKVIAHLNKLNLLKANPSTVASWTNDFKRGNGLQFLINEPEI